MPLPFLLRLAALVFTAVSFVVVGDTAGKLLTSHGVDPVFVAWSRFLIGAAILLPFCRISISELRYFRDWKVVLRSTFIACGILCILIAVKTEPIANVFGAFFIGPVISYILAILFLGETPSRTRTALLALGFIGVMFVVKPGFGGSIGMAFALAAGVFYGAYLAMTRAIAVTYRPGFLLISQLFIGSILLTPLGLTRSIPEPTIVIMGLILLSALGSAIGNYLLVIANKSAEASLIAPLVYTQLVSATLAGIIVFKEWPDLFALIGLALIAFSGFGSLIIQRQQSIGHQPTNV